jgi:hypothetical protein
VLVRMIGVSVVSLESVSISHVRRSL